MHSQETLVTALKGHKSQFWLTVEQYELKEH